MPNKLIQPRNTKMNNKQNLLKSNPKIDLPSNQKNKIQLSNHQKTYSCNQICAWQERSILMECHQDNQNINEQFSQRLIKKQKKSIPLENDKQKYIFQLKKEAKFLQQSTNQQNLQDSLHSKYKFPTLCDIKHTQLINDLSIKQKMTINCKNNRNFLKIHKSMLFPQQISQEPVKLIPNALSTKLRFINRCNFSSYRVKNILRQRQKGQNEMMNKLGITNGHLFFKKSQKKQKVEKQDIKLFTNYNHVIKGSKLNRKKLNNQIYFRLKNLVMVN